MKSSPEPERVLLPTFEEMMGVDAACAPPAEPEPAAEAEGQEAPEAPAPAADGEAAKLEALLAGMRREAIAEAARIVDQAREEAAAIGEKARKDAQAQARAELAQARARLEDAAVSAAEALKQARRELCGTLEPYLLDTALRMAESILHYELKRDGGAYVSIVRNILEQTFMAHNVELHLPPARFDELAAGGKGPFAEEMQRQGVEMVRDPQLDDMDCLVTSDMGAIRGGVKTQLARIRGAFAGQGGQ